MTPATGDPMDVTALMSVLTLTAAGMAVMLYTLLRKKKI